MSHDCFKKLFGPIGNHLRPITASSNNTMTLQDCLNKVYLRFWCFEKTAFKVNNFLLKSYGEIKTKIHKNRNVIATSLKLLVNDCRLNKVSAK